jgi:hypothetical protein
LVGNEGPVVTRAFFLLFIVAAAAKTVITQFE